MRPEILQQMLQTVLNIIMFEDCRNQWSMSRPLLGLILLNEDYFKVRRIQGYCVAPGTLVWTGLGLGLGLGGLGTKGLGPGLDKIYELTFVCSYNDVTINRMKVAILEVNDQTLIIFN